MEIDINNISRLYAVMKHRIIHRKIEIYKKVLTYLFLYGGFAYMFWLIGCLFDKTTTEIGMLLCSTYLISCYIVYIIINHLISYRIVSHATPIIFETILIVIIGIKFLL